MTLLDDLVTSHATLDIQSGSAGDHLLPADHQVHDTHTTPVGGHLLHDSQCLLDTHIRHAVVDHSAADHSRIEAHSSAVGGIISPTPSITEPNSTTWPSGWGELRICADLLARAQDERKAVSNMLLHTDADLFGEHAARLKATEEAARKMMVACYKRVVPTELIEWQKNTRGLGDSTIARILGHLGDPYIATPHWWEGTGEKRTLMQGEPYVRTISQLWQYCGHGDPMRRPIKGMTAEQAAAMGSPRLKMLVHLQAECCMKAGGPYRDLYDQVRAAVEDKTHTVACVRCGPSGKPKEPGTPWNLGHQHAHALRLVGKAILRDMWLARHDKETK